MGCPPLLPDFFLLWEIAIMTIHEQEILCYQNMNIAPSTFCRSFRHLSIWWSFSVWNAHVVVNFSWNMYTYSLVWSIKIIINRMFISFHFCSVSFHGLSSHLHNLVLWIWQIWMYWGKGVDTSSNKALVLCCIEINEIYDPELKLTFKICCVCFFKRLSLINYKSKLEYHIHV